MATAERKTPSFKKDSLNQPEDIKIGIVVSRWNDDITSNLLNGAQKIIEDAGISADHLIIEWVPGSFELPLGAQYLIEYKNVDAVICLGCVIRGETAHFDFVCKGCSEGILNVSLKYNRPVMFGVLTDDNRQQSKARSGGKLGNKGEEAALAVLEMIKLKQQLKQPKGKVGF